MQRKQGKSVVSCKKTVKHNCNSYSIAQKKQIINYAKITEETKQPDTFNLIKVWFVVGWGWEGVG
jgi:hypothetical protein